MKDLGVPGASIAPLTRCGEMGSTPFIAAIAEMTRIVTTLSDPPVLPQEGGTITLISPKEVNDNQNYIHLPWTTGPHIPTQPYLIPTWS